jgi:hypothetical protein
MTAAVVREDVFLFVTLMFVQQGVRPWWEFDRPHLPPFSLSLSRLIRPGITLLQVAVQ